MEDFSFFLFVFFSTLAYFWIADRVRHAIHQKEQEEFWREVIRRTEQKKKIDRLYGRGRDENR